MQLSNFYREEKGEEADRNGIPVDRENEGKEKSK